MERRTGVRRLRRLRFGRLECLGEVQPRPFGRLLPSGGRRPARRRHPAVHGPGGLWGSFPAADPGGGPVSRRRSRGGPVSRRRPRGAACTLPWAPGAGIRAWPWTRPAGAAACSREGGGTGGLEAGQELVSAGGTLSPSPAALCPGQSAGQRGKPLLETGSPASAVGIAPAGAGSARASGSPRAVSLAAPGCRQAGRLLCAPLCREKNVREWRAAVLLAGSVGVRAHSGRKASFPSLCPAPKRLAGGRTGGGRGGEPRGLRSVLSESPSPRPAPLQVIAVRKSHGVSAASSVTSGGAGAPFTSMGTCPCLRPLVRGTRWRNVRLLKAVLRPSSWRSETPRPADPIVATFNVNYLSPGWCRVFMPRFPPEPPRFWSVTAAGR